MAATIRVRKFLTNRLLGRKQFVVDVLHPDKPNVAVEDLKKELADRYRGKETCVFIFGLKTQFGGGKSTGFGLIYDNEAQAKKTEPKYRLLRNGLGEGNPGATKSKKERKNRMKKLRGIKKAGAAAAKKK